jgi:Fe-S-cluster-containing dehydrogenase component
MYKENGKTSCTASRCLGCWMCVMACPYGVITAVETALKCDLCPDRVEREGRARYACVDACPTGALVAGTFQEFRQALDQPVELSLPQPPSPPA